MANEQIRERAKKKGVPMWKIGDKLGKCENTIQRALRHELSDQQKELFLRTIDEIASERK